MKYELNTWYGWNGGECPVHPETIVECYGSGNVSGKMRSAARLRDWSCIDAFRVIREHREPREWWIVHGVDGMRDAVSNDRIKSPHAIHVREVIE